MSARITGSYLLASFALIFFCNNSYALDCPEARESREDGKVQEGDSHFTYESRVYEREKRSGGYEYKFQRCIDNESDEPIWTHWKGILSDGWIEKNDRKLKSQIRQAGDIDPKDKQLWYGGNRGSHAVVQTKCWPTEKKCETPETSSLPTLLHYAQATLGAPDQDPEQQIVNQYLEKKISFATSAYEEFFVPLDAQQPKESLVKVNLALETWINPAENQEVTYILSLAVPRSYKPKLSSYLKEAESRGQSSEMIQIQFPGLRLDQQRFDMGDSEIGDSTLIVGGYDLIRIEEMMPFVAGTVPFELGDSIVFDTTDVFVKTATGEEAVITLGIYKPR